MAELKTGADIVQSQVNRLAEQMNCEPSQSAWTCRKCQTPQTGFMPEWGGCEPCTAFVVAERKLLREQGLKKELAQVGIPPKFLNFTFKLPAAVEPYVANKRGLCLTGGAGVGKTMSMCLLVRDWYLGWNSSAGLARDWPSPTPWLFISYPVFIMELQDSFRKEHNEETALDMLKFVAEVPRLIIDDLGAEKLTAYVQQSTYFILNERENYLRPTYITTNFSMNELNEQFDSRISSRIAGMCDVKELAGKDRRLERAK